MITLADIAKYDSDVHETLVFQNLINDSLNVIRHNDGISQDALRAVLKGDEKMRPDGDKHYALLGDLWIFFIMYACYTLKKMGYIEKHPEKSPVGLLRYKPSKEVSETITLDDLAKYDSNALETLILQNLVNDSLDIISRFKNGISHDTLRGVLQDEDKVRPSDSKRYEILGNKLLDWVVNACSILNKMGYVEESSEGLLTECKSL